MLDGVQEKRQKKKKPKKQTMEEEVPTSCHQSMAAEPEKQCQNLDFPPWWCLRSGQILLDYRFSYLVGNRVNVMYPVVVDNKVTSVFVL